MSIKKNKYRMDSKKYYLIGLLIILTISISLYSCRKITCEAFDLNHEIMKWHFFPDLKDEYKFYDTDSIIITFNQTLFTYDQYEERRCHQCACLTDLRSRYESTMYEIHLDNFASYNSLDDWGSYIYYIVDEINTEIRIEDNFIVENRYSTNENKEFKISKFERIDLLGVEYVDVTQFDIIDTLKARLEIFWIQEQFGLLGFQIDNNIWVKE